ncbi:MAG: hypothetical protein U0636_04070 [Phycisphaerales bacterium]
MHGVPADLPLGSLIGRDLLAVNVSRYQLDFSFEGGIRISPTTCWDLRGPTGTLIDSAQEPEQRENYRVHEIIGIPVVSFSVDAPRSFTLIFATGHHLTIGDDGPQYESCTIDIPGQPTIII